MTTTATATVTTTTTATATAAAVGTSVQLVNFAEQQKSDSPVFACVRRIIFTENFLLLSHFFLVI